MKSRVKDSCLAEGAEARQGTVLGVSGVNLGSVLGHTSDDAFRSPDAMPHRTEPFSSQATEPSWRELLLIECLIGVLFIAAFSHFRSYLPAISTSGDNRGYIDIARAIRAWHFDGLAPKLFWGTSYAIAGTSAVFRLSERTSLLVVSLLCCLGSVWLALRMWGGWVTAFFVVLSMAWIQKIFLGGSEPLFVLLIFSALLMARDEKWILSAVFASLATIVRPAGFFALASIGLVLLYKRDYRRLAGAVLIGLLVGVAYILPLWIYFGDPLATYHGYRGDWDSRFPIGLPFYPIIKAIADPTRPTTNLVLNTGWICFSLAGLLSLFRKDRLEYLRVFPLEAVFAVLYLVFLFTYNSSYWSYSEFPRFVIPVIPILLVGFESHLPKRRFAIWGLAGVSSMLAAFSAIGIHNILHR